MSFTFPKLPRPTPLQVLPRPAPASLTALLQAAPLTCCFGPDLQNPLLSSATVTDRAVGGGGEEGMAGAAAKPVAVPAAGAAPPRRGKVPFEIGYSQVDWIQHTRSNADLTGQLWAASPCLSWPLGPPAALA